MNRMFNSLDPAQLNLLLFGVILLAGSALGSYVVWPKVETLRSLVNTLAVLEGVATNGKPVGDEVTTLEAEVESLNYSLHGDVVKMPSNQLEAFIIGRMQDISWQHGIELRGVQPGTGNRIQIFEEVLFELEVAGGYFDIHRWLLAVRDEFGMVVIKHFNIVPIERNSLEPRLLASLTIVFYRETDDV